MVSSGRLSRAVSRRLARTDLKDAQWLRRVRGWGWGVAMGSNGRWAAGVPRGSAGAVYRAAWTQEKNRLQEKSRGVLAEVHAVDRQMHETLARRVTADGVSFATARVVGQYPDE